MYELTPALEPPAGRLAPPRIPMATVLLHGARERIYKLIKDEPGIHAQALADRLGLGWGTAVYHLTILERHGLVVAKHAGRYKHFFANGSRGLQHKDAVGMLRNPTARRVAEMVAENPGTIQKELCVLLGMSPSLASWHLRRLAAAGVVEAKRQGRVVRYLPGAAWAEVQGVLGPAPPAAAPEPAPAPPLAPEPVAASA